MAYDEALAARVRANFQIRCDADERKMFGGLCFMVEDHMCCGIVADALMARVGPERYAACLEQPGAREMDFTGRPMKGMVYVRAEAISKDADLARWLDICRQFVASLPPKKAGKKKGPGKRR